jgi:murein DD-endopeptidase MepM/ murein hydrolase activator NlpD
LVAGAYAPVFSPINGVVTQIYIDGLGNPVIRIENAQWVVLLLHLNPDNVSAGQTVSIWQQVGTESNRGNTWSNGKKCGTGSDCGFHTHFSLQKKGEFCKDPFQRINFPATGNNP